MNGSNEANAVLDAAVMKKIAEHYRHAKCKHPNFADRMFYNEGNEEEAACYLSCLREDIMLDAQSESVYAESLAICELAEAAHAYAVGDKVHAVEEVYDAIAVLLRMVDVLEGRQALGGAAPEGGAE